VVVCLTELFGKLGNSFLNLSFVPSTQQTVSSHLLNVECEQCGVFPLRLQLLLPFVLAGCANSSLPNVYEARGFTDDEIDTLQSAANEWCTKSEQAHCVLVMKNVAGSESSTVTLTQKVEVKHCFAGIVVHTEQLVALGNCLATVDHDGIRSTAECVQNPDAESFAIQVVDSRQGDLGVDWFSGEQTTWEERLRTTFLHELGHAFGRPHSPKDGTVMNAVTTNQVEHLTEDDLSN